MVAYLLLGMFVAYLNRVIPILDPDGRGGTVLAFLSALGVIVLLFRVGIESDRTNCADNFPGPPSSGRPTCSERIAGLLGDPASAGI